MLRRRIFIGTGRLGHQLGAERHRGPVSDTEHQDRTRTANSSGKHRCARGGYFRGNRGAVSTYSLISGSHPIDQLGDTSYAFVYYDVSLSFTIHLSFSLTLPDSDIPKPYTSPAMYSVDDHFSFLATQTLPLKVQNQVWPWPRSRSHPSHQPYRVGNCQWRNSTVVGSGRWICDGSRFIQERYVSQGFAKR